MNWEPRLERVTARSRGFRSQSPEPHEREIHLSDEYGYERASRLQAKKKVKKVKKRRQSRILLTIKPTKQQWNAIQTNYGFQQGIQAINEDWRIEYRSRDSNPQDYEEILGEKKSAEPCDILQVRTCCGWLLCPTPICPVACCLRSCRCCC